jgi:hypothetical protein
MIVSSDIPSYRCKPQDIIRHSRSSKITCLSGQKFEQFYKNAKVSPSRDSLVKLPTHLRLNAKTYKATVNQIVTRNSIGLKVNELLVCGVLFSSSLINSKILSFRILKFF